MTKGRESVVRNLGDQGQLLALLSVIQGKIFYSLSAMVEFYQGDRITYSSSCQEN